VEQILHSLGISDLTTILQGGALAAIVGIVGANAAGWARRQVRRGAWREIRRSEVYRQLSGLLADTWLYLIFALFVLLIDPVLVISLPLVFVLASVVRALVEGTGRRVLVFFLLILISAVIAREVYSPFLGGAIVMAGILRYSISVIWRKAKK